jgi:hypothetical protein
VTTAELDQLTAELEALVAEQESHRGCFVAREFPEDIASTWLPSEGSGADQSIDAAKQIGPRELWSSLLTWALLAVSIGALLAWKTASPISTPAPVPDQRVEGAPDQ